MSLISCPECKKEISDKAEDCPYCGYPISEENELKSSINSIEKEELKENYVLGWIIFIITMIMAIILFFTSLRSGLNMCFAALFVCPNFVKYIRKKKNKKIKSSMIFLVWFLLFIVSLSYIPTKKTTNINNKVNKIETQKVKETPTEKSERLLKEKNNFIESCKSYSYKEIARNPKNFLNSNMKFTGQVQQVTESKSFLGTTTVTLLLAVTKNEYDFYEDNMYCTYTYSDGESKILEDDIITLYGVCKGDYTYISVLGASITVPKVDIKYYTIDN